MRESRQLYLKPDITSHGHIIDVTGDELRGARIPEAFMGGVGVGALSMLLESPWNAIANSLSLLGVLAFIPLSNREKAAYVAGYVATMVPALLPALFDI